MKMRALLVLLVIVDLAASATASAAPASTTFAVRGFEYAFTSTVGQFAGSGRGVADVAVWDTRVVHEPLGSAGPAAITGGSFAMRTTSLSTWAGDFVTGQYTGGTISVVDPGRTAPTSGSTSSARSATSRRAPPQAGRGASTSCSPTTAQLFGSCVTYSATVTGAVSFPDLPPAGRCRDLRGAARAGARIGPNLEAT